MQNAGTTQNKESSPIKEDAQGIGITGWLAFLASVCVVVVPLFYSLF